MAWIWFREAGLGTKDNYDAELLNLTEVVHAFIDANLLFINVSSIGNNHDVLIQFVLILLSPDSFGGLY